MEIIIEAEGEIVERTELLNGTQTVAFEAAGADGRWAAAGSLSWNIGLDVRGVEGDVMLTRDDGAEVFASLTGGEVADEGDAEQAFRVEYEVDGGSGEFDAASGRATAEGALAGGAIRGVWRLKLEK